MSEKYRYSNGEYGYESDQNQTYNARASGPARDSERPGGYDDEDVFGHEEGHDVRLSILYAAQTDGNTDARESRSSTRRSDGQWYPS